MIKLSDAKEQSEYNRLFAEWRSATNIATEMLARYGMNSPEFFDADRRAGALWKPIQKLLGIIDNPEKG